MLIAFANDLGPIHDTQWSRKPKNVQKFRIALFWHVVGLRDVKFTKM